jgi:hypothetical protein
MAITIPPLPAGLDTLTVFIRVRREDLVYLNGLLETHDDLCIVKTLEPADGVVAVMTVSDRQTEIRLLLGRLALEVPIEFLEPAGEELARWEGKIHALE